MNDQQIDLLAQDLFTGATPCPECAQDILNKVRNGEISMAEFKQWLIDNKNMALNGTI